MNLEFLKNYSKIIINLRGQNRNKIHSIIRGDYFKIINLCEENNIKLKFLNEGNLGIFQKKIEKGIFGKIKYFLFKNVTLFLPTMNRIQMKKGELIITDNQFLITNGDYIIFLDWVHSFVGYNAKGLYNPFVKILIKYFISRKNLKYLITSTKTGLEGIKKYLGESFFEKYKEKFIVEYPKLLIDEKYLEELKKNRKENLKKQTYKSFLFIGKDFVRKGGIETIRLIYYLFKEGKINKNTHKFTFITKKVKIPDFILKKYKELEKKGILQHFEPEFKIEEIYEKFYTTNKIFLLPTRGDPFGMVFLEARAFDMDVITTNQGPAKELFDGYDKVKFVEFVDEKYNWLRRDLRPKWNQSELMNKNYNIFFKDFSDKIFY